MRSTAPGARASPYGLRPGHLKENVPPRMAEALLAPQRTLGT